MSSRLKSLSLAVAILVPFLVASSATAQSYPDRPIRIIVPFPAGGALDVVARLVGAKLTDKLGQQVVVDNRPGAGGNLGSEAGANSPPDGYTLVMGTVGTHAINSSLYRTMPYDPSNDFEPISLVASAPNILVVRNNLGVGSLPEFVALAKREPGKLTYASGGNGTTQHLAAELLKAVAGIELVHVPYRGVPPAMNDLLAGRVDLMFANIPVAMPHVTSGGVKALAITTKARSRTLPELPTIAESGFPDYEVDTWYALFAPAGTASAITDLLNKEVIDALRAPEIVEKLVAQGIEPVGSTAQELRKIVVADRMKWADVVAKSGAKID